MGSINRQISRYETTAVYTHPDAKVDIILVHGLNGDPEKTWAAKNGVFWPADLLPASLREARANVLVYGYNADVYSKKHGSTPSDNFLYMHAQTLVTSLTHYRKDEMTSYNPIIWVCHSLGGVLVKRALLYSNDLRTSQHEDYRSIYVSTYGMVFLGTPHTGSDIATWGTVLQAMSDAVVPKSFFQSESVLLKTLKRDNETLQNINSHFLDIYQRFKILMAHENHKTDFKGTKTIVVDAKSACPQLPGVPYYAIEATHSGMCKFDSKNAPGYRTMATSIREWVTHAPDVITTRWRIEEDDKLARAKHEIEERMKPWIQSQRLQTGQGTSIPQQNNETIVSPSQEHARIQYPSKPLLPEPDTPNLTEDEEEIFPSQQSRSEHCSAEDLIFVKPSVFRPNTYFKGREKELKLLHKMLRDRKRRSVGTSSVLIQSMPGGGKSHLARQYVFQHRYDYPGGIFWIRAKSLQELEYGYYDIARVAGLSEANVPYMHQSCHTGTVVKAVQAWLSSTSDWLLVLDGIHFDIEGIQNFIPFSKNTSLIYTSTERTMGEEYRFDNPQVLALDSFTKREAQELLFEEMGKKPPYTHDDLQRAEELVDLMDRLPLMIHVAALQLKATREPLAKYLRSYKNRPKVGNLPAYRAVYEQLEHRGAVAALNLISLLAFFGTQIPVEMIGLGARSLDKRTPVKSKGPESQRGSLNLTISILISFALIERNEAGEASSETTRSTRSVDMNQDSLDVIRVHGIVQAFFVGLMNERHEVYFWLERAICVYCGAFDASIHRVDKDSQTGTPDDYRRFLIHGRRLLSHLDRFERRYPDLKSSRNELEGRVDSIQQRIDQLAKRVGEAASHGSSDLLVSVFERTNSLSETESSPSSPSLIDYATSYGAESLESPCLYSPTEQGPYHWHVPADYFGDYDGADTSRTVTPQPAPTEVFESISMPCDDELTGKFFGPHHRTIRRHASRRYRDHAGAWRASPQIISDPRVTMSRETAKGFINHSLTHQQSQPFSSADNGPLVQSEAEMSLNQINQVSPKPPSEPFGSISSAIPPRRPRHILGRLSYANPRTEEVKEPVSPTFSYPPPTSRNTATMIMRQKEMVWGSLDGRTPTRVSSPLIATPRNPEEISLPGSHIVETTHEDMTASLDSIIKSSSGPSSRLTLGLPSYPLSEVPLPPMPIPIEINTTSSLRSAPSASSQQVDTQPPPTQSSSDDTGSSQPISLPPMIPYASLPYPYMAATPAKSFNIHNPPPPWVSSSPGPANLHPEGYSSQPMSRNTSHQSNNSIGSNRSFPRARSTSPTFLDQPLSSSPASQVMRRPRARCPSVVETEPSPRLKPLELEPVVTSYQLFNKRRESTPTTSSLTFRGRRRSSTPSPDSSHTAGSKIKLLSRFRSLRTRSEGTKARSQSAGYGSDNQFTGQLDLGRRVSGRSPPGRMISAEKRTRTGSRSGGIRISEDMVVEFGSPPDRTAAIIAEVKRRSPGVGSGSPLAAQPLAAQLSRSNTEKESLPLTSGSPPESVGLGIQQKVA
ncbi:hypothetical protein GGS21DRAFT_110815 [Xylaria nigripes]|nr:hypothetical protein GGS21DRAFT_110815 [Xylaria nigripes]